MHGESSTFYSPIFSATLECYSARKRQELQSKIVSLPDEYSMPLSSSEVRLHNLPISELVSQCRSGTLSPLDILTTCAKKALMAQKATNCIADLVFKYALLIPLVAKWGSGADSDTTINDSVHQRSLLGVPISIKGKRTHFDRPERHIDQ